ncbi:dihydroxyacetone kinase subunit DhaK [Lentzea tibetensis]|uniref:Dihydroxyacetone kinase subunit DhaK n=1 Tax=Lentzea tibetensis TaxID=2591470 RepID=A0A563EEX7_9PSEU|nr:dihydroxyacetone kinase subunit DhaK [Lentzea tibetensis]TWP43822.1 dihydroxyacetone kinase subunit DhaK [Lentzea tibetensis]
MATSHRAVQQVNSFWRKLLVEMLGTATLVFIGVGSVPATLIVGGGAPFTVAQLGTIAFAFATAVVALVYAIGHISGCHINPAITLAMAAMRRMPWLQVPGYLAAQFLGAVLGALAIVGVLGHQAVDVGLGIASYSGQVGMGQAFFAEVIGTFLLAIVVFGATDSRSPQGFAGLAIGMAVFAIIVPVAWATGAAINPARAFGPMVVGQFFGGTVRWDQFPVYLVAEVFGALAAGGVYFLIRHRRSAAHAAETPSAFQVARKKLINTADMVVPDALEGLAAAHRELRVQIAPPVILRFAPPRPGKVALVSGGGSGHEPLHGGFVGYGMLDAACPGEIFTSPAPGQILAATRAVYSGAGVLFVVKNYTGDVMNFKMAEELAADEGIEVTTVVVDDDVAVQDSTWTAGRRGTGAALFVEKIAGALAEHGAPLWVVAEMARRVNAASRSFAIALTACTTPATGRPGFDLPADEIEIGVGIHGEPGQRRDKMRPVNELVDIALAAIRRDHELSPGDNAIVMVNGMGGTPLIELYIAYAAVARSLACWDVKIMANLVGNYVTSLDMTGVSISICKADADMLALWGSPVHTPALRWGC